MKSFGLIGGLSWHSTVEYYGTINRAVNQHFGNNTNPSLYLASLNQHEIHQLQKEGDWLAITDIIVAAARKLEQCGAQGLAMCANTPHKVYDLLQAAVDIPVIHIADAIASSAKNLDSTKLGLLGTRFTMQDDFIKGRLSNNYKLKTIVPTAEEQEIIHGIFLEKLSMGIFDDESRAEFLRIISALKESGAEAVILGCTEFPLLLRGCDATLPTIDSLQSHCDSIISYILD